MSPNAGKAAGTAERAVVIGGGVVGSVCALRLQQAGLDTLVLEAPRRWPPASFGNAGHIAIEQVAPLASPDILRGAARRLFALGGALDFRLRDVGAWAPWAARYIALSTPQAARKGVGALGALLRTATPAWRRLSDELGGPPLLIENGHLVVWESDAASQAGRLKWGEAEIGGAELRDLTGAERAALTAQLPAAFRDVIAFEGTGQVRQPAEVLQRLRAAHEAAGGARREAEVSALQRRDGRADILLSDGERLSPSLVVLAGGAGSGPLMRGLGHAAPVVAERGYHIEGDAGAWKGLPPVVFEERDMVVTRFKDRLRATSFVEFAGVQSAPDPRKWRRLKRHVAELGVPMQGELSTWVGARPTLPDYLPAIGRSRLASNLIYAFGHQHLGMTLAPTTGELVADLALERAPAISLEPFDIARFDRRRRAAATVIQPSLQGVQA